MHYIIGPMYTNSPANLVQAELDGLATITSGSVSVSQSDNVYTIEFIQYNHYTDECILNCIPIFIKNNLTLFHREELYFYGKTFKVSTSQQLTIIIKN